MSPLVDKPYNALPLVLAEQTAGKEKVFLHPKLLLLMTQDGNDFSRYEGVHE